MDSAAWGTLWDPLGAIQAQPEVGPPETSQPPYATASPPLTVRYTPTPSTTLEHSRCSVWDDVSESGVVPGTLLPVLLALGEEDITVPTC